jgi:hypothetical protein
LKGSLFSSAKQSGSLRCEAGGCKYEAPLSACSTNQSVELIAALHQAAQNVPVEAVWDSMLNVFEKPEQFTSDSMSEDLAALSSSANITALLTAAVALDSSILSPRRTSGHRAASPVPKMRLDESPQKSTPVHVRNLRSVLSKNASENSLVSTCVPDNDGFPKGDYCKFSTPSTTAGSSTAPDSPTLGSPRSPCRRASRICRTSNVEMLRQEQLRAKRRAAWVA